MCDVKKLCTCENVKPGQDHWKLQFHYGQFPSWDQVITTRPEHAELAKKTAKEGEGVMGPLPIPLFKELYQGFADKSQMNRVLTAEDQWLNEANQFDFDYEPFQGDRLLYVIWGEEIAFSYSDGKWRARPHQAYSADSRMGIDADKEDEEARSRASTLECH